MKFTNEEIKAAKQTRDVIISNNIEELKAIYMAGEICMWDEMQQANGLSTSYDPAFHKHDVNGSALLSSLLNKHREIISSPLRFNGVSNEDIIKTFAEHGIKYEQPF